LSLPIHQPYKNGKGGVDIGLKPIDDYSWLEIDNLFEEEISLKKRLYKERKDQVLIAPSESINIQREVLDIVLEHLNEFYGDSYEINKDSVEVLQSNTIYFFKDFENPLELASLLVQEDLIIMQPKKDVFYLKSASLCAPTRWSLKEKFNLSLSEIHKEVPGYKEKIDLRVNNIFQNLPDQKIFERYNWSIFDSPELFQPIGSKTLVEIKNIDPEDLYLRVERQTLRRLKDSRSILFTVRVHVDPMTSILSDKNIIMDLIKAIQNLEEDMKNYKVIQPFEEKLIKWLKLKIVNE
tara:strand:+ start:242 stop:1123 length:882 start_codon:yes stop_codon:yes gene_type:complete